MSGPITWRNVTAPSNNAASLLSGAGQSLDRVNGMFQGLIDDQTKRQEEKKAELQDIATQDFLDKIGSYGTPEELAAAKASGEIDAFKQSLGPNLDRGQVRGAVANRVSTLQGQETSAYEYDQTRLNRETAPLMEQLRGAIATDDDDLFTRLVGENKDALTNAGKWADINQSYVGAEREREIQGRADQEYWKGQKEEKVQKRIDSAMLTAATSGEDTAFARATLEKQLKAEGLPATKVAEAVANFDGYKEELNGLTTEDKNAIAGETARAEREAAQAIQEANRVYKLTEEANPMPAPNGKGIGDAVQYLEGMGVTNNAVGSQLQEKLDDFVEKKGIGPAFTPYLGELIHKAVTRIGTTEEFWGGDGYKGDREFEVNKLSDVLGRVYDEMLVGMDNIEARNAARKARDKAINEANESVYSRTSEATRSIKSLYRAYSKSQGK